MTSARVAQLLTNDLGYTNVKALKGGFNAWIQAGGALELKK